MRWLAVLLVLTFAAGCVTPPRRAKSCTSCSRKRPASHATHVR
ncbi:MAG: hypothetical protein R3B70_41835 [Polyangiaceae bacterium]